MPAKALSCSASRHLPSTKRTEPSQFSGFARSREDPAEAGVDGFTVRLATLFLALVGLAYWAFAGSPGRGAEGDRGVATYYTNGQVKMRTAYEDGVRHGPHREWYADGTLRVEGRYAAGQRRGLWAAWKPDGQRDETRTVDYGHDAR